MFIDEAAKERFEQAYDLYQKIAYEGITDRNNDVGFNFKYVSSTEHSSSKGANV